MVLLCRFHCPETIHYDRQTQCFLFNYGFSRFHLIYFGDSPFQTKTTLSPSHFFHSLSTKTQWLPTVVNIICSITFIRKSKDGLVLWQRGENSPHVRPNDFSTYFYWLFDVVRSHFFHAVWIRFLKCIFCFSIQMDNK